MNIQQIIIAYTISPTFHCVPDRQAGTSPAGISPHKPWRRSNITLDKGSKALNSTADGHVQLLPSNSATFLVVHLDELPKTAGVVIVGCFSIAKSL